MSSRPNGAGMTKERDQKKTAIKHRAAYTLSLEGLTIGFLGHYPEKTLSEELTEEFDGVDLLLVPVGANDNSGAEAAATIVNQLEPKIVIPMLYKIPGFSLQLDPLDRFLKEMGGKGETLDKLLVKKADLAEEKTRLVILSPQRG